MGLVSGAGVSRHGVPVRIAWSFEASFEGTRSTEGLKGNLIDFICYSTS